MSRYKVAQDVEAEDKILGPFSFRQFIYLLVAAAGIALAWGLSQVFFAAGGHSGADYSAVWCAGSALAQGSANGGLPRSGGIILHQATPAHVAARWH